MSNKISSTEIFPPRVSQMRMFNATIQKGPNITKKTTVLCQSNSPYQSMLTTPHREPNPLLYSNGLLALYRDFGLHEKPGWDLVDDITVQASKYSRITRLTQQIDRITLHPTRKSDISISPALHCMAHLQTLIIFSKSIFLL